MKFKNSLYLPWDVLSKLPSQGDFFSYPLRLKCISILLLFAASFSAIGQTHDLKKIIRIHQSSPDIQEKLDSFFLIHRDKMPADSLADCFHEIGYRLYFKKWTKTRQEEDLNQAISFTTKSIDLKKEQRDVDTLSLQKSLSNIGTYQRYGDYILDAITTYNHLIELDVRNRKTYNSYLYLSSNYAQIGDYYRSVDVLKRGIPIIKSDQSASDILSRAYYNLADRYSSLDYVKHSEEISKYLELSSTSAAKSKMRPQEQYDLINKANHLNGNRLLKNSKFKEAVNHLNKTLNRFDQGDSTHLAIAHNSLGLAHLKLGELDSSFYHLKKSTLLLPSYSAPLENLGDYYIQKKEFEKGLKSYHQAIIINLSTNNDISYLDLPTLEQLKLVQNKDHVLSHLIQKANAWSSFYQFKSDPAYLEHGLATFQLADQLIDEIRFQSFEEQSKLFWQDKGNSLYIRAVSLCHKLDKPKMAYYFMEKNKALLLLGDATSKNAKNQSKLPLDLIANEFGLKRRIHLLQNSYAYHSTNSDAVRQKIILSKNRLKNFQDSIYAKYPEYARAARRINILTYEKFKEEHVSNNNVIAHYISGDTLGFGLIHIQGKSMLFEIEDFSRFVKMLNNHLVQLRSPLKDHNEFSIFLNRSSQIFESLFPGDMMPLLENKRLTIIPDNNIQQLPFETLISDLGSKTYLLENSDIGYQYSISYHTMNEAIKRDPGKGFLGIAPITFDELGLPSLSHSNEEIIEINKIYGGKVFTKEIANKQSFLSNLANYKIIHLSTHASSGDDNAPWIAFHDQKLYLDELYGTNNQSEMVVLSACNTSIGEYKKGEGAMSLARGFFYSGANSVLATLWATNDKSSKNIMIDFYNQLDSGKNKSTALREAKLNYLKSNHGSALSPYYWASSVIIGNNNTVSVKNGWTINMGIAILILIAILSIFFWMKRKKKLEE